MDFILLKCPSCEGEMELDAGREFGYCTYCGTKVMIPKEEEETFEEEQTERKEQLVKRGNIFLRLKEYGKARENFEELIEDYPDCAEGYYKLIIAKTNNFSAEVWDLKEIGRYSSHMVSVAPEEEKESYLNLKAKIESYVEKVQLHKQMQKEEEILNNNKRVFKTGKHWVKRYAAGFIIIALGIWLLIKSRLSLMTIKSFLKYEMYQMLTRYLTYNGRGYFLLLMCAGLIWVLISIRSCLREKKEKKEYEKWQLDQEKKIQNLKDRLTELEKITEELQREIEKDAV